jgi:hypothetical protein
MKSSVRDSLVILSGVEGPSATCSAQVNCTGPSPLNAADQDDKPETWSV